VYDAVWVYGFPLDKLFLFIFLQKVAGSAFASYVYDAVWVYAFPLDKLFLFIFLQKVAGSAFASYVYDAVWVYAFALDKLFKNEPGALEMIHSKSTAM
jgi:hypothetical protein